MRLAALLLVAAAPALAAHTVPLYFSHEGRLLDANDKPVNGQLAFTFTLFTHAQPATDGSYPDDSVWTETETDVPVNDGVYAVTLGKSTPLDPSKITGKLFLEITVAGDKLAPRLTVGATLYAYTALTAGNADTVGGIAPGGLVQQDASGNATLAGTVTAAHLAGDGSALTSLGAASLTGTVADARLSTNVALLGGSPMFAGDVTAPKFLGDGSQLTSLAAPALTGTVADARLSTNVALLGGSPMFAGNVTAPKFIGDGSQLANLTLPADLAHTAASQTFTGANTFSGAATFSGTASFTGTGATNFGGSVSAPRLIGDGSGLSAVTAAGIAALAARPTSGLFKGMLLFNTTSGALDFYDGAGWRSFVQQGAPASCAALKAASPSATDGAYTLNLPAGPVSVNCDMTSQGGGWTEVVQCMPGDGCTAGGTQVMNADWFAQNYGATSASGSFAIGASLRYLVASGAASQILVKVTAVSGGATGLVIYPLTLSTLNYFSLPGATQWYSGPLGVTVVDSNGAVSFHQQLTMCYVTNTPQTSTPNTRTLGGETNFVFLGNTTAGSLAYTPNFNCDYGDWRTQILMRTGGVSSSWGLNPTTWSAAPYSQRVYVR